MHINSPGIVQLCTIRWWVDSKVGDPLEEVVCRPWYFRAIVEAQHELILRVKQVRVVQGAAHFEDRVHPISRTVQRA